jgi:hypothetical protein
LNSSPSVVGNIGINVGVINVLKNKIPDNTGVLNFGVGARPFIFKECHHVMFFKIAECVVAQMHHYIMGPFPSKFTMVVPVPTSVMIINSGVVIQIKIFKMTAHSITGVELFSKKVSWLENDFLIVIMVGGFRNGTRIGRQKLERPCGLARLLWGT